MPQLNATDYATSKSADQSNSGANWTGVSISTAQVTARYQNGSQLSGELPTEVALFRKGWRTITHW